MIRLTALTLTATLMATPLLAESSDRDPIADLPEGSFNEELGLPYWAPGRGEIDHDAVRRRTLVVLERQVRCVPHRSQPTGGNGTGVLRGQRG